MTVVQVVWHVPEFALSPHWHWAVSGMETLCVCVISGICKTLSVIHMSNTWVYVISSLYLDGWMAVCLSVLLSKNFIIMRKLFIQILSYLPWL